MTLFALALAPAVAIFFYIIAKDKYNKEPFRNLFVSFILGVFSTIPAVLLQLSLRARLENYFTEHSLLYYALFAFGIVGFSEEFSKYLMLRYYAYRQKAFDEPLDGIIYGVMVSLGFATLENIGYVMQYGLGTAIVRMFISVPAHASFGIIMGYYVGLAKFNKARSGGYIRAGLFLAMLFHGAFDFFLFIQQSEAVTQYVSVGMLSFGALTAFYISVRLSLRSIYLHQELSRIEFEKNKNILL